VAGTQSQAAESARAELDRARRAAEEQLAQARRDAERDQAGQQAGLEAQLAAAEEARPSFRPAPNRPRRRGGRVGPG
jgi:hypothetical protein